MTDAYYIPIIFGIGWFLGFIFGYSIAGGALRAFPDPPPDRRDEAMRLAMRRARDAFAILACERGVNEDAASAVGWQKHVEAMRGLARAALAELDAAMKPQEPSHD